MAVAAAGLVRWSFGRRVVVGGGGGRQHVLNCCRYYSTNESDDPLSLSIRALMRASAQPVAVITTLMDPQKGSPSTSSSSSSSGSLAHGATLSSFSTVSLDPPLLVFSLRTPSRMADALRSSSTGNGGGGEEAHFVINILSDIQEDEAGGFARGLKPFSLPKEWKDSSSLVGSKTTEIDPSHPLSKAPFHPSSHAKDRHGVAVPVLSNSLGSLACSIVSVVGLKELKPGQDIAAIGAKAAANLPADRGSELFVARVHGVEKDSNMSDTREHQQRLPMVYWDQQFKSIK